MDDHTHFRLLRLLEANPEMSQRDLARELGMSLGKINYCLNALIEKGWIKARGSVPRKPESRLGGGFPAERKGEWFFTSKLAPADCHPSAGYPKMPSCDR